MKMISVKRFLLFTLATCLFLASKTISLNEPLMTNFQSKEEYNDDNYSEPSEDIIEEKGRRMNLEELNDWELKNIIKMNIPAMKKVSHSAANLPLRFGRNFQEERSIKPAANLPLRFGRSSEGSLSRHKTHFAHRYDTLNSPVKKEINAEEASLWKALDQLPF